jgi:hypothetical protein
VVFNGGANDLDLVGTLTAYYNAHPLVHPWKANTMGKCPDTQKMYETLTSGSTPKSATITDNLNQIVKTARQATAGTRMIQILYPYITNLNGADQKTNVCIIGDGGTWHGSKQLVDSLDDVAKVSGNDVTTLDLRKDFGNTPMDLLQFTIYGYPHANADGQTKIAKKAFNILK